MLSKPDFTYIELLICKKLLKRCLVPVWKLLIGYVLL